MLLVAAIALIACAGCSQVEVHTSLGDEYCREGEYVLAVQSYTRAVRLDPASAAAYHGRALAHFHNRDFAEALRDARRAERLGADVAPEFLAELRALVGRSGSAPAN
jgi:Flp pilus assembly protein TadD